jgi:hypothetical protein
MDDNLVGYLLNALPPDERRAVETRLRDDADARRKLDVMRAALAPLEADRPVPTPPVGLVERTLACIAAATGSAVPPRKRAAVVPAGEPLYVPSRWRRADAIVASLILVVLGGLGTSAVSHVQRQYGVRTCQNNLRQYHQALVGYALAHDGRFPVVSDEPPRNVAAVFVPVLQESGQLPAMVPECPAVIPAAANVPAYAYTLGYRDADGRLHGLRVDPMQGDLELLPILADRPAPVAHGSGHNVLFVGGQVRFCTNPNVGVGGDHIFLNQASRVAAGLHRLDTVLAPGDTSP